MAAHRWRGDRRGLVFGVVYGLFSRNVPAAYWVNGAPLTPAERVTVVNIVRGLDDSDDPRLNEAANRIAGQIIGLPMALLAGIYVVIVLATVAGALWVSSEYWLISTALTVVGVIAIRSVPPQKAAAQAYLAAYWASDEALFTDDDQRFTGDDRRSEPAS